MIRRLLSFLAIIFVGLSTAGAQRNAFISKTLESIAKEINYLPVDTLPAGIHDTGKSVGLPIYAKYNDRHVVTNLGFKLFTPELRMAYASDVYDFLERYFLELLTWNGKNDVKRKMLDDKVYFTTGNISDIKRINDSTHVAISRTEDKFYEVTWSNNDTPFLSLAFPLQYELLLGMPQVEIEQMMFELISSAVYNDSTDCGKPQEYSLVKDSIYRSEPVKIYELESVNNATYYSRRDSATYELLLDTLHKDLSAMNLFHKLTKYDIPMKVEQSVYGFNKLEYTVTLQQWMRYVLASKADIYTAVEEEYEDGYRLLVIARNMDMGYNHLLSVLVPRDFLTRKSAMLRVKLNAFIPTHNVKNLFGEKTETTSDRKRKHIVK